MDADWDFETRSIHAGEEPNLDPGGSGDLVSPIHLASTFAMDRAGEPEHGYKYSRLGNPTRDALETRLASLDDAGHGMVFGSGMAAIATTCLSLLGPGDSLVAFDSIYGGTKVFFGDVLADLGISVEYVDATDPENVRSALTDETGLLWMETPTNPLLRLCDLEAISKIAHDRGCPVAVDNTFASPYFQRPLSLGCDAVVYSTTKYLNGHTDSIGGAVVTNDDAFAERIAFYQEYGLGTMLSPFDCYLVLRGTKTLPLRMRQHQHNATAIARFLEDHSKVRTVHYPGLESHPQHDLAVRQMDGYGGVLSFEIEGDGAEARALVESLELFTLAVSLGSVESLVEHPASMSASYIPEETREAAGITEQLIRVPVGVENPTDLVDDLDRALARL
jgi:cystathionine gamma-lyase